jgi:hypothetical protein
MADEENVKVEEVEEAPKSKEEMRHIPHEYEDNNGWCAGCGRSEGFKAHLQDEDEIEGEHPAPVAEAAPPESEDVKPKRGRKPQVDTPED